MDKQKNKVVDFGLLNTLKYINILNVKKLKKLPKKAQKIPIDEAMRIAL